MSSDTNLKSSGLFYKIIQCDNITTESCFPSVATVNLKQGKTITMSQLQIGDHVKTGKMLNLLNYILLYII